MKGVKAEIIVFCLLLVSFTNYLLSNKALNFANSKKDLTNSERLSNAINELNGEPTIKERKLSAIELRDINRFTNLNNVAQLFFFTSLFMFVLLALYLAITKKFSSVFESVLFILITSWIPIILSYFIFNFWKYQQIGDYYLFSGAGFSPTLYFSVV